MLLLKTLDMEINKRFLSIEIHDLRKNLSGNWVQRKLIYAFLNGGW